MEDWSFEAVLNPTLRPIKPLAARSRRSFGTVRGIFNGVPMGKIFGLEIASRFACKIYVDRRGSPKKRLAIDSNVSPSRTLWTVHLEFSAEGENGIGMDGMRIA